MLVAFGEFNICITYHQVMQICFLPNPLLVVSFFSFNPMFEEGIASVLQLLAQPTKGLAVF